MLHIVQAWINIQCNRDLNMNNSYNVQCTLNKVNTKILELLNAQTSLISDIINLDDENERKNINIYNVAKETINYVIKSNTGPLPDELIQEIFSSIFKIIMQLEGIPEGKNLLVSASHGIRFNNLHEMFDITAKVPIIIAGPCSIENITLLDTTAKFLKENNLKFLRGGAYKPRTYPYAFQGLREDGLKILQEVSRKYDLVSVTEVVDTRHVEKITNYVDILQVGTRNMQNYELLKEIGRSGHSVILKRGMCSTINEFILAAEYIALQGNRNIILCERGIRTFETKTRNTLDISSIPIIRKETNLSIIADLSHSLGRKDIIVPIAKSVLAAGAEGLMVEVHPQPELAFSDSKQQMNIDEFRGFLDALGL